MRIIKACVRCNGAFLATVNMLVCDKCYGSPDDHEISRAIKQAEMVHWPKDAYLDVIDSYVNQLRGDSHGR
jgi:hypothetical protein